MNHAVSRGNNVGSFEDKKPDLNRTLIDLDTRDQNAEGNGAQELSTDLDSGHQKPFVEQVSELLLQTATQSGGNSYALVPSGNPIDRLVVLTTKKTRSFNLLVNFLLADISSLFRLKI